MRDVGRWTELALACTGVTQVSWTRYDPAEVTADEQRAQRFPIADLVKSFGPYAYVDVNWQQCGQINAAYFFEEARLMLCYELLDIDEKVARFIVAHELAHAAIRQLHIPFTGSEEDAADELAARTLINQGKRDLVVSAAKALFEMKDGTANPPWDEHAEAGRRGWVLNCLVLGSLMANGPGVCSVKWTRANNTWTRLLKAAGR